jgi:hypothetical protein
VDSDHYLLPCYRYIEPGELGTSPNHNAVRARYSGPQGGFGPPYASYVNHLPRLISPYFHDPDIVEYSKSTVA